MSEKKYDVVISYIDEVHSKIGASREILLTLREEFSFFANGYKFHPSFKKGLWDGKISMINRGIFFNGLLKDIIRACKDKGLSVHVENIKNYMPHEIDDSVIDKLASYVKFPPYDYQLRSVKESLSKRKLLIISPTSSGKSLIAYLLYRYCSDNNIPLLITVPSVGLVTQLYEDFKSYINDDHDIEKHVHMIYANQEKTTNKPCVITTWQSAYKMEPEWFSRFKFYIQDEAHLAESKSLTHIIESLKNCPFRIGMTGTLDGTSIHELEMRARFGEVFRMVTTRELIDRGLVTDIEIKFIRLLYDKKDIDKMHAFCKNDYQREIDYIINHDARNEYLINLGLTLEGTTLMLFNRVEAHGEVMLEEIERRALSHKKKAVYIVGKTNAKERERIRKLLDADMPTFTVLTTEKGDIIIDDTYSIDYIKNALKQDKTLDLTKFEEECIHIDYSCIDQPVTNVEQIEGSYILLASYGTMSTGISIKRLHNLILCHPYKSKILNLQSIGRILRKSVYKNKVFLYDFSDDFRKGKKVNHVYKHGIERLAIYESEQFDYDLLEDKLGN